MLFFGTWEIRWLANVETKQKSQKTEKKMKSLFWAEAGTYGLHFLRGDEHDFGPSLTYVAGNDDYISTNFIPGLFGYIQQQT